MKFTLSWLKTHLDTGASCGEIAKALTMLGLEVETLRDPAAELLGFVVADVLSVARHPEADKLSVCQVTIGGNTPSVQVVCGAPNARAGMKSVYAPAGTFIPGKSITLSVRNVRGVSSNGMLCSGAEIGFSDDHDGILDLPEDVPVGISVAAALGLDDPVFTVALTPNRGDCAAVRGIARDLAAAGLGRLLPLTVPVTPVSGMFPCPVRVRREFAAGEDVACSLFAGRVIRGVRNGESPLWLRRRLLAVGLRPISALVDITNFMTLDVNRPLHVFDCRGISGDLVLRPARQQETLAALNGRVYALAPPMTVIADDSGPLSLGGIMGGVASSCKPDTVDVFLEAALFDPMLTGRTGRALMIESDARYRFERGIDPEFTLPGLELATRLILDLCGGEPSDLVVAGTVPAPPPPVALRPDRAASLCGVDVGVAEQIRCLSDLGFIVSEGSQPWQPLTVAVPSWRPDIAGEADLVEEVMRIKGFDHLPAVPLPRLSAVTRSAVDAGWRAAALVRRTLASIGLVEAVTWSMVSADLARCFGGGDPSLTLTNPISTSLEVLRPSLLPQLLAAAVRNLDRGLSDIALFELGPQYRSQHPDGQERVAAGVRSGQANGQHWLQPARMADVFDAKADAYAALAAAGVPTESLQTTADAPPWYHPGRSGCLRLGSQSLACFGEAHPAILEMMNARATMVMFEVLLDRLPRQRNAAKTARPRLELSPFQPVERDFAFVVAEEVAAERLLRAVRGADRTLVTAVRLFDVFRGPPITDGQKSLALSVTLQPPGRTLTESEIEAVSQRIIAAAAKAAGATLRV